MFNKNSRFSYRVLFIVKYSLVYLFSGNKRNFCCDKR